MLRVAAVQAEPVWMNREASIDKAVALLEQAATHGARVVVFPETFIPGYPWWTSFDEVRFETLPVTGARQAWYLDQGVDLERGDLEGLIEASRSAGCFVSVGVAERSMSGGSLYCSMVMIDPAVGIVGVHRKVKPTHTERVSWADGDGNGLRVHEFGGWKIGGLNCWENWLPLARYTLYAQGEQLHLAAWPGSAANTADGISQFIAKEGGVFVVSASGLFTCAGIPDGFPDAVGLRAAVDRARFAMGNGGAVIAGPAGTVIASMEPGVEGIIYADLDVGAVGMSRTTKDQAGHYHRPDVFSLTVDRSRRPPISVTD